MTDNEFTQATKEYLQRVKEQSGYGAVILYREAMRPVMDAVPIDALVRRSVNASDIDPEECLFPTGEGNLWIQCSPTYAENMRLTNAEAYDCLQDSLQAFQMIHLTSRHKETK